ncbi:MAG TPA: bifunctional transaldolase/phosoglucose isomerase, partial [Solirubrobacteraceae bacterium]|nr:bifunctional transaldolase/phosoglucose isomerase [Solirubrobacteraceae bacterium]
MSTLADVNPHLKALTDAGVAVWLDQLGRSLVASGELKRMVEEESLHGVTSNPSIFEKSILGSNDYEEAIKTLAAEGKDAKLIYDTLAIADVRAAADVLASVHEETGGTDGFVSLEVAPDLARDTEGTLASARGYWSAVERPNVMIKIPGTPEGVPAIEQAIYEGINVNVTLLFAVEAYQAVAEAYIRGLERRHAEGKSLDVHSVASFFVSRVDTLVDKQLEAIGGAATKLKGTAALANARAAYLRFMEIFNGERWDKLAAAGAVVQRPLWASTGVKNPAYPDTLYVDQLIAPYTVNTMPLTTLNAVADHGTVAGATARQDPSAELKALADAGIDMTQVTSQLLEDGIKLFEQAMDQLIAGIDQQRLAIITSRPATIQASLPAGFEDAEVSGIKQAEAEHVAARVWKHDPALWGGPGVPEIEDRLGWLAVSQVMEGQIDELQDFATELQRDGYTDAILLGMGGSSLGPEVIRQSFGETGGLRLQVLDSTHPDAILAVEESVDLAKTIFIVSSKSGGTIETLSHYKYFKQKAKPEQFVVVTDAGSPLAALAESDGLRRTFLNPTDIGGRYSVMSYFGMVPAALAGVPIGDLLKTAQIGEQACSHLNTAAENSGLWLGVTAGKLAQAGRDKLTMIASKPFESFGLWFEQLVAESTGKQGKGILPVVDEPLVDPHAYGDDRVFIYLRNGDEPDHELDGKVDALIDADNPAITLSVENDPGDLGRLFFVAEFATAVAGWALAINPFDQPNVQEAKDNTNRVLAAGEIPQIPSADNAALKALLDTK